MGLCLSAGPGHQHHDQYVTDDEEDQDGFCTPESVSSQGESHNPSGRYSFEFPNPPRISADVGDLGALGTLFYKQGSSRPRSKENTNSSVVPNQINTLDMFLGGGNARSRVSHEKQLCTGDYSFTSYLSSPLLKGFDVHAMEAVAKSYAESAAKAAARDAFVFLEENDTSLGSSSSSASAQHDEEDCIVFTPSTEEAGGGEECADVDEELAKSVNGGDTENWEELRQPCMKAANLWVEHIPNEEGITETFTIFTNSMWDEPNPVKVESLTEEQNQHEEAIAEITDKHTTSPWEEPKKISEEVDNLWVQQNEHEEVTIAETTDKFTTSQWEEPKKPSRKVENLWVQQNQDIEEAIDKTIDKFNNNKSSSNFTFWVSDNNNGEPDSNEQETNERWVTVLNSIQARAKARRRQRRKSSLAQVHGAATPDKQRSGIVGKAYGGAYGGGGGLERIQRCGSIGIAPGAGAPEIIQMLQRWGSIGRAHGAGAPEIIQRLQRWGTVSKAYSAGSPERFQRCSSNGNNGSSMSTAQGTGGAPLERVQRTGSNGKKKTVSFSADTKCPPNSPDEFLAAECPPPSLEESPTLEDFSAIGREVWEKVKHSPSLSKFEYNKLCELSSEILSEVDTLKV
ncbi:unnamed protein product [Calypogeia fissa]